MRFTQILVLPLSRYFPVLAVPQLRTRERYDREHADQIVSHLSTLQSMANKLFPDGGAPGSSVGG